MTPDTLAVRYLLRPEPGHQTHYQYVTSYVRSHNTRHTRGGGVGVGVVGLEMVVGMGGGGGGGGGGGVDVGGGGGLGGCTGGGGAQLRSKASGPCRYNCHTTAVTVSHHRGKGQSPQL